MHKQPIKAAQEIEYFRQLMIYMCESNNIKDSSIAHKYWLYSPPHDLLHTTSLETLGVEKIKEKINETYKNFSIEDFFNVEPSTKINKKNFLQNISLIKEDLKENPTIIVVLSGIFSEFIDSIPFQEVFYPKENPTQKYLKQLASKNPIWGMDYHDYLPNTTMDNLSLEEMGSKTVTLDELIRINMLQVDELSIPTLFMETPRFSFESIGDQYKIAKHYVRRLEKFANLWQQNNQIKRVILLGYSRGSTIGLEMANLIKNKNSSHPFKTKLKGVISLGGVLYGTHLAQEALSSIMNNGLKSTDPQNAKILFYLSTLANNLEYAQSNTYQNEELFRKSKIFLKNTMEWLKFFKNLGLELALGDVLEPNLDIKSTFNFQTFQEKVIQLILNTSSFRSLDKNITLEFLQMLLFNSFHLKSFYKEYDLNIKKFKITVDKIIISLQQITIDKRMAWWKKNKIPTKNILYWPITAITTSANATPLSNHIINNPWTYVPNHLDDWLMRHCHDRLAKLSGSTLNDGQVFLPYAMFQDELNAQLNPYYVKNKIKGPIPLILGVNHWGMAFPIVHPRTDSLMNAFPRKELLKSLVLFLTKKIKNSEYLKK